MGRQVGKVRPQGTSTSPINALSLPRTLVGPLEELVEQSQLVHQFQRRGVDRVAAEVAEKILVLLQNHDIDPSARASKIAQHHPRRPAPDNAAAGLNRFDACGGFSTDMEYTELEPTALIGEGRRAFEKDSPHPKAYHPDDKQGSFAAGSYLQNLDPRVRLGGHRRRHGRSGDRGPGTTDGAADGGSVGKWRTRSPPAVSVTITSNEPYCLISNPESIAAAIDLERRTEQAKVEEAFRGDPHDAKGTGCTLHPSLVLPIALSPKNAASRHHQTAVPRLQAIAEGARWPKAEPVQADLCRSHAEQDRSPCRLSKPCAEPSEE